MRKSIYITFLISLALTLLACKRDPLCYDHAEGAGVHVRVDWSESGLTPSGATLMIYDHEENLYGRILMADPTGHRITLDRGRYSFIVFNEAVEDFQRVGFRDMEKYTTATIYARPDETDRPYMRSNDDVPAARTPDIVASASMDVFEVTQDMVRKIHGRDNSAENTTVTLTPKRLTNQAVLTVHVKGLHNASTLVDPLAILTGMAQSVSLHNRTSGRTEVRHYFEFSQRGFYPGSDTDGTIQASASVFGLPGCVVDSPRVDPGFRCHLNIIYRLSDNVTNHYPPECPYDITDKISISAEDYTIHITAELGLSGEGDEPIVLPKPQGGGDDIGGFDPEIKDWEDVVVPLPI